MTAVLAPATVRPVWIVSAGSGLVAACAVEIYGLLADAVGVPMRAGNVGADTTEPITAGMFAMGTCISVFWGTVLAVLLARFAATPARTYLRTTLVLTALSMAGPLAAGGDTPWQTRLMLCLAHLLAAAVVIPAVTRSLRARESESA
ncbi:MAG: DUF6069 family protein [Umezawaea sp.]